MEELASFWAPKLMTVLSMIELITPKMIVATFNENPINLNLCSSPTNIAVEKEVENFYIQSTSRNNAWLNYVTIKNSAKNCRTFNSYQTLASSLPKWGFELVKRNPVRDHSFSKYAEFSQKRTFLTTWYAHVCVRIRR